MRRNKRFAAPWIIAAAAVTVIGTSAFAESRPSQETRRGSEGRGTIRREGGETRRRDDGASRRSDESRRSAVLERRQTAPRSDSQIEVRGNRSESGRVERNRGGETRADETRAYSRGDRDRSDRDRSGSYERGDRNRDGAGRDRDRNGSYDRNGDRNRGDRNRGNDRNRGGNDSYRNGSRDGHRGSDSRYRSDHRGNRQPYYAQGRVSRYHRHGNGYRVYIVGVPYPFFVPDAYWRHDRFRVGLSIRLGGYYNDLGYYDYYDGRGYSSGGIRGIVESVDYRRDTFVVRNEATGSFVTVVMRDRRPDNVRAGDYVELYGDWTRSGVFQAYDVDRLDYDRNYDRDYDR